MKQPITITIVLAVILLAFGAGMFINRTTNPPCEDLFCTKSLTLYDCEEINNMCQVYYGDFLKIVILQETGRYNELKAFSEIVSDDVWHKYMDWYVDEYMPKLYEGRSG